MSDRREHFPPDDLLPVAEWLGEERPSLGGLSLDRVKDPRASAGDRHGATRGHPRQRSFLEVTYSDHHDSGAGILMSLSGAGLAVSGLSDSGDASSVQYPTDPGDSSRWTSLGDSDDSSDAADLEPAAQESSGDSDKLPFTGFAAIPVLIGGLALLSSGFVLRGRSARE
jgi:hypothetical protein